MAQIYDTFRKVIRGNMFTKRERKTSRNKCRLRFESFTGWARMMFIA